MARGCSVFTLYSLNLCLFLLGAAMLAAPLVSCTGVCNVSAGEMESLRFVKVLQIIGGSLVVFSLLGCCLAKSGKKRYRCPYLLVLLALVLGGGAVVALDQGLLYEKLATFDPNAPDKVQHAIDGLATSGMQSFYADFSNVFHAAECKVESGPHDGEVQCKDCAPLEAAFTSCVEDWVDSKEATKYMTECTAQFEGKEATCDEACTKAFCQCAGTLGQTVEDYSKYAKYALLAVGALLFLLLVASVCVSRKQEQEQELLRQQQLGQVLIVEAPTARRQPVLA